MALISRQDIPISRDIDFTSIRNRLKRFFDEPFGFDLPLPLIDEKRMARMIWSPDVEAFMAYANRTYGPPTTEAPRPYRLIAEVDPLRLPAFRRFLEARGLETNQESLRTARLATLAQLALAVVAVFGVILVATAFSAMVLYLQLAV